MLTCPRCASIAVTTELVEQVFRYGVEPEAVDLRATIPARKCGQCGFEYADHEAEEARDRAVNQWRERNG